MHYAEIAVHEPKIQGVFHYHIPPELAEAVQPGAVVVVPFGQRQVYGVVLRLLPTPAVPETKPVLSVPAPEVALTPLQLRLAEQIAADTLASLSACIALMLPPGVLQAADTRYHLTAEAPAADTLPPDLHETERRLLALLHARGPLRGRQLDRALPRRNWRAAAARLQRRGWLESEPVLPPPRLPGHTVRMVRLGRNPLVGAAGGRTGARNRPHPPNRAALPGTVWKRGGGAAFRPFARGTLRHLVAGAAGGNPAAHRPPQRPVCPLCRPRAHRGG